MNSILLGLVVLVGIIGARTVVTYRRRESLKQWWQRATEALKAGDFDGAEKALRKCVAMVPLLVPARSLLGSVLAKKGNLREAEEEMKMAAELMPRQAAGHYGLGLFYAVYCPERGEEAIASFTRALEFDPGLRERLAQEPALKQLRENPQFWALL